MCLGHYCNLGLDEKSYYISFISGTSITLRTLRFFMYNNISMEAPFEYAIIQIRIITFFTAMFNDLQIRGPDEYSVRRKETINLDYR
jgi:hypothetical protein